MAITISKEPSGIYPAYNDSFIEFSSDLSDNNRAEISALPALTFPKPFSIFPDSSGKYVFNLKEIAKTILNENEFEDANYFTDAFFKSITGLYLSQDITIEVFNDSTSETLDKSYEFFKSVKQITEVIHPNAFQLLTNSINGIDHYLTYFEGFPFSFDIQRVVHVIGKELTVKNVRTSVTTIPMNTTVTGSFRMNVDRGNGTNWTDNNFLPLIEGLNYLEIYEDGAFKTNLYLKKRKICSGIYLKWFNNDGGFNHYLFEEYLTEEIEGKDIDFVGANTFRNVGELNSNIKSVGKQASNALTVRAKCDAKEAETLKSLYSSPMVQMYTSKIENIQGEFINVAIEGAYNHRNKISNNEFILSIILPEMITAKL